MGYEQNSKIICQSFKNKYIKQIYYLLIDVLKYLIKFNILIYSYITTQITLMYYQIEFFFGVNL